MQGVSVFSLGLILLLSPISVVFAAEDSQTQTQQGILDNKTFVGEVGKVGETKGDTDTFTFQNGKFHSSACDSYKFGKGMYQAQTQGDAVTFEAETESPTDGTMTWKGMVKGNMLEGTATWLKDGKAPVENWFKGTLKTESKG